MIRFEIDVTGMEQAIAYAEGLKEKFEDFSDLWPEIRDEFFAIEKERFDSEGDGEWAALSPRYAAWKAAHYGTLPILQREGSLYESLTSETSETIVDMQANSITIGTSVLWARYHQFGTANMPARPPIDITPASESRLMNVVENWVARRLQEE